MFFFKFLTRLKYFLKKKIINILNLNYQKKKNLLKFKSMYTLINFYPKHSLINNTHIYLNNFFFSLIFFFFFCKFWKLKKKIKIKKNWIENSWALKNFFFFYMIFKQKNDINNYYNQYFWILEEKYKKKKNEEKKILKKKKKLGESLWKTKKEHFYKLKKIIIEFLKKKEVLKKKKNCEDLLKSEKKIKNIFWQETNWKEINWTLEMLFETKLKKHINDNSINSIIRFKKKYLFDLKNKFLNSVKYSFFFLKKKIKMKKNNFLNLKKKTFKFKIKAKTTDMIKHLSLKNCNINFLRKNKIFNKGRYSRNRQIYRTGVYWCLYLNFIVVLGLQFWFLKFTIKFTFLWFFFFFSMLIIFISRYLNTKKIKNNIFIDFFWFFYFIAQYSNSLKLLFSSKKILYFNYVLDNYRITDLNDFVILDSKSDFFKDEDLKKNENNKKNNSNNYSNRENFKKKRYFSNLNNFIKIKYSPLNENYFEIQNNFKEETVKLINLFEIFLKKKIKKNVILKKKVYSNVNILIFEPVFDNFFNKKHFLLKNFFFFLKKPFFKTIVRAFIFLKLYIMGK